MASLRFVEGGFFFKEGDSISKGRNFSFWYDNCYLYETNCTRTPMNLWIFLLLPIAAKLIRNYLIRRRIIT